MKAANDARVNNALDQEEPQQTAINPVARWLRLRVNNKSLSQYSHFLFYWPGDVYTLHNIFNLCFYFSRPFFNLPPCSVSPCLLWSPPWFRHCCLCQLQISRLQNLLFAALADVFTTAHAASPLLLCLVKAKNVSQCVARSEQRLRALVCWRLWKTVRRFKLVPLCLISAHRWDSRPPRPKCVWSVETKHRGAITVS